MELRELRSLAALAELGSITRIASKLHLSPAAVHKQLKTLESELNVKLYEKVGRRLTLTQPAQILLPYVRELLGRYDAALEAVEEWKGLRRGVVHVGAGPTISSYILPCLLKNFRRRFPDVDLVVETGNTVGLIDNMNKGALDLALLIAPDVAEEDGVQTEAAWPFEIVLVSNLPKVPANCPIAALRSFPFILFQKGTRVENVIDRYLAEVRFQPRVIMRFDNAEAIKALVRTGMGISMLPYWAVDSDLRKGVLSLVRQREHPLLAKIVLVTRSHGYVAKPVAAFIEMAKTFDCREPRMISPHALAASRKRPTSPAAPRPIA